MQQYPDSLRIRDQLRIQPGNLYFAYAHRQQPEHSHQMQCATNRSSQNCTELCGWLQRSFGQRRTIQCHEDAQRSRFIFRSYCWDWFTFVEYQHWHRTLTCHAAEPPALVTGMAVARYDDQVDVLQLGKEHNDLCRYTCQHLGVHVDAFQIAGRDELPQYSCALAISASQASSMCLDNFTGFISASSRGASILSTVNVPHSASDG